MQWHASATPGELRVKGNDVLLQQALLNLLYNAFDATLRHDKPTVGVEISTHNQHVQLRVMDNGDGVSEAVAAQLFEPFHTNPGRSTGLGLGLTLARQIVVDHGGGIDYQPSPDRGSIFTISLPLVKGVPA